MDETSVHNNYSFLNYDNISCEMQPEPRNLKLEGTDCGTKLLEKGEACGWNHDLTHTCIPTE